jgi:hypothetical protein
MIYIILTVNTYVQFGPIFFFLYWDLNSGPSPWATPPTHFFLFKIGSHELFPGLASNHDPLVSASWVARITGVSHRCLAWPILFFDWLGFELRPLSLQSRHSTTWATPLVHFSQVILEMGVSHELFGQAGLKLQFSWSQPPKELGLPAEPPVSG